MSKQPWSSGKVGTIGASYLGWDQYHAAMYHPPHLTAMFALVGGANAQTAYGFAYMRALLNRANAEAKG
jgi:predicted acyl esterase